MSLALTCACGARFEVEETFAGQTVGCPECQRPVSVSAVPPRRQRTSGFAVASVVSALVLAFTGIGTVLAVLLGIIALVHISSKRSEVTGTGFALFGIVAGVLFTGLFALMLVRTELFGFDVVRRSLAGADIDVSGPLEVTRPEDGFAITRPSLQWGVAGRQMIQKLSPSSDLMLANFGKDAYVVVNVEELLRDQTLEQYRDQVIENYRNNDFDDFGNRRKTRSRGQVTIRQSRTLPAHADYEAVEVVFDARAQGQPLTYLVRIVRRRGSDEIFLIQSWTQRRRFASMEKELRQALDSFRLLKSS